MFSFAALSNRSFLHPSTLLDTLAKTDNREEIMSSYVEKMQAMWSQGRYVCVGLDPSYDKIPELVKDNADSELEAIASFLIGIIEATADVAACYKPNAAFYERYGGKGYTLLEGMVRSIRRSHPDVPIIFDGKRGDIGNTNEGYVEYVFNTLRADACTVAPYMGSESLRPFLDRTDKTTFVLCRTSNPGAGEFQDLDVNFSPLYEHVLHNAVFEWSFEGNVGLVAGATSPNELQSIRRSAGPYAQLLVPGVGAQGGDAEAAVNAARNVSGTNFVINSSRGILYASSGKDYESAARSETVLLNDTIKAALQSVDQP